MSRIGSLRKVSEQGISRRRLLGQRRRGRRGSGARRNGRGARRSAQAPAAAAARPAGRRRDRGRRLRRADRGATSSSRRGVRSWCSRRATASAGKVLNHSLGAGEETERGGTFTGPTQNYIMALAKELGVELFPQYYTGENVYFVDGERTTYNDSGRHRHGSARPADHRRDRRGRDAARPDGHGDRRERSLGVAERGQLGQPDAPVLGRRRTASRSASAASCRWPRGRSSAPSRASCRCSSRSSTSPRRATRTTSAPSSATSTRATAPRCSASSAARRSSARSSPQRLGRRVVLRSPVSRIVQGRRGVRVESKRLTVRAKRVIVTAPPVLAGRIDYKPEPARGPRAARRAAAAGQADQGHRRLRPPVLARRGPERDGASRSTAR